MISLSPILPADTRLFTVVGHFGSGKTEFAVNLALALREAREQVALADLDVVDPYFRSRECAPLLAAKGIRLISSANTCRDADLPSMPAEVNVLLDNPGLTGVLDIGGDPSGARVLARYRHRPAESGAALLCVINQSRPLSDTADKCVDYIRRIEDACGMAVTALVNNTLQEYFQSDEIIYIPRNPIPSTIKNSGKTGHRGGASSTPLYKAFGY